MYWQSASLLALTASLLVAAPALSQPADSVRRDIEAALLREFLTSDRLRSLSSRPYGDYVCVGLRDETGSRERPPPEPLLAAYEGNSPAVVSVSECRVMEMARYMELDRADREPVSRIHHEGDGDPAILYRIGPIEWVRGDSAFAWASYYGHPLHSTDFECDVRRKSGRWTADCTARFIS